jgi:hypothetical protein
MADFDFDEIPAIKAGKRLGVNWCPWMGDFFISHSPRNSNSNAEGPWAQWVDLALRILKDPMTATVRPEAQEAVAALELRDFYDDADVYVSDGQLRERFRRG